MKHVHVSSLTLEIRVTRKKDTQWIEREKIRGTVCTSVFISLTSFSIHRSCKYGFLTGISFKFLISFDFVLFSLSLSLPILNLDFWAVEWKATKYLMKLSLHSSESIYFHSSSLLSNFLLLYLLPLESTSSSIKMSNLMLLLGYFVLIEIIFMKLKQLDTI